MISRVFYFFCVIFPLCSSAVELAPWYPRVFEVQPELGVRSQFSRKIASDHRNCHHSLHATFVNGSIAIPYYQWYGQVELEFADSSHRTFGVDHATMALCYQVLDDVSGVFPVSLVLSGSLSTATRAALNDLSSFHHGKFEGIVHIAVGKEFSSDQFWCSRFWGAVGLGVADVGSPWFHTKLCAEKNFCNQQRWSVFADGLFGIGDRTLSYQHFHGYGPIAHRSVDLWMTYRREFDCGLRATIGGSYRVYAHNFPKQAISGLISFLYPFGL